MLNAKYRIVPFFKQARKTEWNILQAWCDNEEEFSSRLVIGSGGSGKTRLLIEWCLEQRKSSIWKSGFLRKDYDRKELEELAIKHPLMIVIDYAEIYPNLKETLKWALELSKQIENKIRVCLIARQNSDWVKILKQQDNILKDHLETHDPLTLIPISLERNHRIALFQLATKTFLSFLEDNRIKEIKINLDHDNYSNPLYIQMASLNYLSGQIFQPNDILTHTLDREKKFWIFSNSKNVDYNNSIYRRHIRLVVSALTLLGGSHSFNTAKELCARLNITIKDDFFDQIRNLYPGGKTKSNKFISGLEPDLLGEQLIIETIQDEFTPKDFLSQVLDVKDDEALVNAFGIIRRIALYHDDAKIWIEKLLSIKSYNLVLPAYKAMISTSDNERFLKIDQLLEKAIIKSKSLEVAKSIEPFLVIESTSLNKISNWVIKTLINKDSKSPNFIKMSRYIVLSELYFDQGKFTQSYNAIKKSIPICLEELQKDSRDSSLNYGIALTIQTKTLISLKQYDDALKSVDKALDQWDKLSKSVSKGLDIYSIECQRLKIIILIDKGNVDMATTIARHNMNFVAGISKNQSPIHEFEYGKSLIIVSECYLLKENFKKAKSFANKAFTHFHNSSNIIPKLQLESFAKCYNTLVKIYVGLENYKTAIVIIEKMVNIYRKLNTEFKGEFIYELADSLSKLGACLLEEQKYSIALGSTDESLRIFKRLYNKDFKKYSTDMALSYKLKHEICHNTKQYSSALSALINEAKIYRKLIHFNSITYLQNFDSCLSRLRGYQLELGMVSEGITTSKERISILKRLDKSSPGEYSSQLGLAKAELKISEIKQEFDRLFSGNLEL